MKKKQDDMIAYNGKKVPSHLFRTNVYYVDAQNSIKKKLANSFDEFKKLLISGEYFEFSKQAKVSIKSKTIKKRLKNGADSS